MTIPQCAALLPAASSAQTLNRDCYCRTLNARLLREQMQGDSSLQGVMHSVSQTRPHLFSSTVVFLSADMEQKITQLVSAIERLAGQ